MAESTKLQGVYGGHVHNLEHVKALRKNSNVALHIDDETIYMSLRLAIPSGEQFRTIGIDPKGLKRSDSPYVSTKRGLILLDEINKDEMLDWHVSLYQLGQAEHEQKRLAQANEIAFIATLERSHSIFDNGVDMNLNGLELSLGVPLPQLQAFINKRLKTIVRKMSQEKSPYAQWVKKQGVIETLIPDGQRVVHITRKPQGSTNDPKLAKTPRQKEKA